jgi:hypothetical protein
MNLLLEVFQVIVVCCFLFMKCLEDLLNTFCAYLSNKTGVSGFPNQSIQF